MKKLFILMLIVFGVGITFSQIPGCIDPNALNFNPNATVDDGNCDYSPGDVDINGVIDVSDLVMIVGFILGTIEPTVAQLVIADLNSDEQINIFDIVWLIDIILGGDRGVYTQVTESVLRYSGDRLLLKSTGTPAGLQLTVSGDYEITRSYLPSGWELHHNENTILLFSSDGSPLTSETLFEYTGDLQIESALVADWSGNGLYADIETVPGEFTLDQPYPNPFNPVTTIAYSLPIEGDVYLAVYDLNGKQVTRLVSGRQAAGNHTVIWDAGATASGVYFVVLQSGTTRLEQKVVLLK